jgi:hypothetical protein
LCISEYLFRKRKEIATNYKCHKIQKNSSDFKFLKICSREVKREEGIAWGSENRRKNPLVEIK